MAVQLGGADGAAGINSTRSNWKAWAASRATVKWACVDRVKGAAKQCKVHVGVISIIPRELVYTGRIGL